MPATSSDVERIIRELLGKHFAEHALPMPRIAFQNRIGAKSLATCAWRHGADNTTVTIQRSILGDEKTLRRVLAHELIHHWQFLRTDQTTATALAKVGIQPNGHGADFVEYAERINATEGADYVSKRSDQSYDTSAAPPFYILVQPHGNERFGFTVAIRPSAAQKAAIADKRTKDMARLFKITDGRFLNGAPIKRHGGYSIPRDPEHVAFLAKLYATGTDAKL